MNEREQRLTPEQMMRELPTVLPDEGLEFLGLWAKPSCHKCMGRGYTGWKWIDEKAEKREYQVCRCCKARFEKGRDDAAAKQKIIRVDGGKE